MGRSVLLLALNTHKPPHQGLEEVYGKGSRVAVWLASRT